MPPLSSRASLQAARSALEERLLFMTPRRMAAARSIRAPDKLGIGRMQKPRRAGVLGGPQGARQTIKAHQPRTMHPEDAEAPPADPTSARPLGGHGLTRHGEPGRLLPQATQLPSAIGARPAGMDSRSRDFLKRAIRRHQLRQMVPLADTTIYEMEQRGEFPRRFYLTSRCVAWDAAEVEAWLEERRCASSKQVPSPDVRKRASRPVRR